MKSFEKLYLETVDLFEEGLFRDSVWKNNLQSNLETLKTMWPTSDYLELSEMLKDNLWRIEQIFLWSYLDKETLEINLNEHSSLNFYYLSQMITEEVSEDLLKRFHQTNTRKTDTNHILTEMILRKIEDISKKTSFKKTSKDEKRISSCNNLEKEIWLELMKDCIVWEYEQEFIQLLEKISKPRTKITKKDTPYFISQIEDLLSRKYLDSFKYESLHRIFS
jgi:hypothetical protein